MKGGKHCFTYVEYPATMHAEIALKRPIYNKRTIMIQIMTQLGLSIAKGRRSYPPYVINQTIWAIKPSNDTPHITWYACCCSYRLTGELYSRAGTCQDAMGFISWSQGARSFSGVVLLLQPLVVCTMLFILIIWHNLIHLIAHSFFCWIKQIFPTTAH